MSVSAIIRQLCSPCRQTVHNTRAAAVETVAEAIAYAGRVSPSYVGRVLRSNALPKHNIKRIDRLLGNVHLHGEWATYYRAIAQFLLRDEQRPLIIVDWSGTTKGLHTLAAAVPIGGRAATIYAEVHPESKLANREVQVRFLRTLQTIIGAQRRPFIVADAGFSAPFMNAVKELGWDFVIRVRRGAYVRKNPQSAWVKCKDLHPLAQRKPKDLGTHRYTRDRDKCLTEPLYVRLILSKKPRRIGPKRPMRAPISGMKYRGSPVSAAREPWLLATSLQSSPNQALDLYAQRMQIEEYFRDCKSHRFGWSLRHVNSRCHKRMTTLLMLAAIAMTAVVILGIAAELRREHRQYQANTLQRRVLSYFYLGRIIVARNDFAAPTPKVMQAARAHLSLMVAQRT